MKALFTGFFNVSLSGGFFICLIVLLRLLFKKAPKSMICLLWALAIIRLLLPFQIGNAWSLRPEMPVFSDESTQLLIQNETVPEGEVPAFVPQTKVRLSSGTWMVKVDYVAIASIAWVIVTSAMVLYTLISYLRLKYKVRESVMIGENVFLVSNLKTAFLLGYFRPRIYLPAGLDEQTAQMVIAHERMHKKRGDNWLKLVGFICLAIHWFNPLVWIAYILLCTDIEDACDEQVVRNFDTDGRKAYSMALLSCSKQRVVQLTCPVAFGEISIRQRIQNVLNYRKPTRFVCVTVIAAVIFIAVFFMTDPMPEYPPYYKQLMSLVGETKEVVAEEMGIELEENEDTLLTGLYKTPIRVEYRDVEFDLELGFSVVDDRLWSFRYVTTYDANKNRAAEDTVIIAKQLQKTYGEARQNANKRTLWLSEISVEGVLDKFANKYLEHEGVDEVGGYWDLTDKVGVQARTYWEELVKTQYWKNYWPRGNAHPVFGLRMSAWHNSYTDVTVLYMEFDTSYEFDAVVEYEG